MNPVACPPLPTVTMPSLYSIQKERYSFPSRRPFSSCIASVSGQTSEWQALMTDFVLLHPPMSDQGKMLMSLKVMINESKKFYAEAYGSIIPIIRPREHACPPLHFANYYFKIYILTSCL